MSNFQLWMAVVVVVALPSLLFPLLGFLLEKIAKHLDKPKRS